MMPARIKDRVPLVYQTGHLDGPENKYWYTLGATLIPHYMRCMLERERLRDEFDIQQFQHYSVRPMTDFAELLKKGTLSESKDMMVQPRKKRMKLDQGEIGDEAEAEEALALAAERRRADRVEEIPLAVDDGAESSSDDEAPLFDPMGDVTLEEALALAIAEAEEEAALKAAEEEAALKAAEEDRAAAAAAEGDCGIVAADPEVNPEGFEDDALFGDGRGPAGVATPGSDNAAVEDIFAPTSDSEADAAPPPSEAPSAAGGRTRGPALLKIAWGACEIARKRQAGKPDSWEARCCYHRLNDRTGCVKTIVTSPGDDDHILTALKWWLNEAKNHTRQRHHLLALEGVLQVPAMDDAVLAAQIIPGPRLVRNTVKTDQQLDAEEAVALAAVGALGPAAGRARGRAGRGRRGRGGRGAGRARGRHGAALGDDGLASSSSPE